MQGGLEYEADPRHAELIVEQLELGQLKGLSTPGVDWKEDDLVEATEVELNDIERKEYRMVTARMNYLAFDRSDIQFSVKEACREMAAPTKRSLDRVTRIGRYLRSHPRVVWSFPLQSEGCLVDTYTDANWAGCRRSRKSTSGGCILVGSHCVK